MARIDRFIQALHEHRGERLILCSGERALLVIGGQGQPVTNDRASAAHILELLREIAPDRAGGRPEEAGRDGFTYRAPSGAVRVRVIREGEKVSCHFVPDVGESRGAAGPVPGPAAMPAPASAVAPTMLALLRRLVSDRCSDLHLSAGNPPLFRKDGDITSLGETAALTPSQVRELLLSITPPDKREEFEQKRDVDFSYEIQGVARFRSNLFLDRLGMGGVFRIIPTKIPSAEDLGLPPQVLGLCDQNKGLVLVTGPTGSGKSTTLAAMLDYVNRRNSGHIITIEDPIEFVHQSRGCLINQREVGTHTNGFKEALRAALREDPDIVLVGEMRDLETVSIALETAETGHLVFATLHTNTAASTVDRIIDQFPSDRQGQIRTMLSESLNGVVTQTLCKKKGGGRVAAFEILLVTPAISNLIREGKTFQIPSIMQTSRGVGMCTLNDSLLDLVRKGLIDQQEAFDRSLSKSDFKQMLTRNNIRVEVAQPA